MKPLITVWDVNLQQDQQQVEAEYALLSQAKQQRADRFVRAEDRRRFICAHFALEMILSNALGVAQSDLQFSVGQHGKPFLENKKIHFNLSHSGDRALVAVSDTVEVGVDVECHRPLHDFLGLAERFFAQSEYEQLVGLPEDLRLLAFYRCWTLKEAYIKLCGLSIGDSLKQFEVCFSNTSKHCLIQDSSILLTTLFEDDEYTAALSCSVADCIFTIKEYKNTQF